MSIRREWKQLYPADWKALSARLRRERAEGRCEDCDRPQGLVPVVLPDGRWSDGKTWRDARGRQAPFPDIVEFFEVRRWRGPVRLACTHVRHRPWERDERRLRVRCQLCHLRADAEHHRRQRWITVREHYAAGDLFMGRYRTARFAGVPKRLLAVVQ
jgi:hypothetical protein